MLCTATVGSKRVDTSGQRLPQAIAHRGYKAKHPENTIKAFEASVQAGAQKHGALHKFLTIALRC